MPVIPLPLGADLSAAHGAKPGDTVTVEVWTAGDESAPRTLEGVLRDDEQLDVDMPVEFSETTVEGRIVAVTAPKAARRRAPAAAQPTGDDLYSYIAQQGIDLPREVVSRYLLSLKTKPFVILTGISGTGKTKIAQLVAEYYTCSEHDRVEVLERPEDTAESFHAVVTKSMLVHGAIAIRIAQIRDYLAIPERGHKTILTIELPEELGGGDVDWALDNIDFTNKNINDFQVRAPAGFRRKVVDAGIEVGDQMRFDVIDGGEGRRFRLSFIRRRTLQGDRRPDTSRFAFVPVRPDWTDSRSILGYYNPLLQQYSRTPVLELLLRASREYEEAKAAGRPPAPYFLLFDEMNLAKVEYYFAEFLSLMESRKVRDDVIVQEGIPLHSEESIEPWTDDQGVEWTVPQSIAIPPNLLITGTVNVDETTYMFSPKVLDRANVIEFQDVDVRGYLGGARHDDGGGALVVPDSKTTELQLGDLVVPERSHVDSLGKSGEVLAQLYELLESHHRHFGYRVINEIAAFLTHTRELIGGADAEHAALDVQILQKVLPKLHGTQGELGLLLRELLAFSLMDRAPRGAALPSAADMLGSVTCDAGGVTFNRATAFGNTAVIGDGNDAVQMTPARFPRSARKLHQMLSVLAEQSYVSFVR